MATNLSAVIDRKLKTELRKIAEAEGRSLSNLVSLFLTRGVNTLKADARRKGKGVVGVSELSPESDETGDY